MLFGLFLFSLSFVSFGMCTNPFIFQVKNANLTIHLLKQPNYGSMNKILIEEIHEKLRSWENKIALDPLLFENPVTNFQLLKMLRVDIQEDMIPRYLMHEFRRMVNVPTKKDLKKSAILIHEMMAMYELSTYKDIAIIKFSFLMLNK